MPKRYRHIKPSVLAKRALVAPSHDFAESFATRNTTLEPGQCYFQQALEDERQNNPCKVLADVYAHLFPRCQSLALVLHNLPQITTLLVDTLALVSASQTRKKDKDANTLAGPSILRLVATLARDVRDDLFPTHFERLLSACLSQVEPALVEYTTLALSTVGQLFVFAGDAVIAHDPKLASLLPSYLILAHETPYVRRLAGQAFAFIVRKQSPKHQAKHLRALLSAPGPGAHDLRDGVAQLVFHVFKGVLGGFHSNARRVLKVLLGLAGDESVVAVLDLALAHCQADCSVILDAFASALDAASSEHAAADPLLKLALPWAVKFPEQAAVLGPACARLPLSPALFPLAAALYPSHLPAPTRAALESCIDFYEAALATPHLKQALLPLVLAEAERLLQERWVRLLCTYADPGLLESAPIEDWVIDRALDDPSLALVGLHFLAAAKVSRSAEAAQKTAILLAQAAQLGRLDIFAACVDVLRSCPYPGTPSIVDACLTANAQWAQSPQVLLYCASLAPGQLSPSTLIHIARLGALDQKSRILAANCLCKHFPASAFMQQLASFAEMEMDYNSERPAVQRLEAMTRLASSVGEADAKVAVTASLSLFEIKFRPLWQPVSLLVAELSAKHAGLCQTMAVSLLRSPDSSEQLQLSLLSCIESCPALRSPHLASVFLGSLPTFSRRLLDAWLKVLTSLGRQPEHALLDALHELLSNTHHCQQALACLLSYPGSPLRCNRDLLEGLCTPDSTALRDSLVATDQLARTRGLVLDENRRAVVPVAVRILFGRLLEKPGRHDRFTPESRRQAVLAVLAELDDVELDVLWALVLKPFASSSLSQQQPQEQTTAQMTGLVVTLKPLLSRLGSRSLLRHQDLILSSLARILALAVDEDAIEVSKHDKARLRAEALDRLRECLSMEPSLARRWLPVFADALAALMGRLADSSGPGSALFRLVCELLTGPCLDDLVSCVPDCLAELVRCVDHESVCREALQTLARLLVGRPDVFAPPIVDALLAAVGTQLRKHTSDRKASFLVKDLLAALAGVAALAPQGEAAHECISLVLGTVDLVEDRQACFASLRALVPLAQRDMREAVARLFGPTLRVPVSSRKERQALVQVWHAWADSPRDRATLGLLEDLNAFAPGRADDELDFSARLRAYESLAMQSLSDVTLEPLVQHAMFDMHSPEFALRTAASAWLESVVRRGAPGLVLPGVWHGLKAKSHETRRGFLQLLRVLVVAHPELHPDLHSLCNEDEPEADFFVAATHIQIPRRARGLTRLARQLKEGAVQLTPASLKLVVLPLALHSLYESGAAQQELQQAGVSLTSAVARLLSWGAFSSLLRGLLVQAEHQRPLERLLLRVACLCVDEYDASGDKGELLARRFLPMLGKHLKGEPEDKRANIRVHVGLAMVKLLKLLPAAERDAELPSLLLTVAGQLRQRDQQQRDEARTALAAITSALGPDLLPKVFEALRQSLRSGFQVHVLGYTVHSILQACVVADPQDFGRGLASCLPGLCAVFEDELFGETASQKDATQGYRAKTPLKEAKGPCKSLDSLELCASAVPFMPCTHLLTGVVLGHVVAPSAKVADLCAQALKRVAAGLAHNPSVEPNKLLMYVHHLLEQHLCPALASSPSAAPNLRAYASRSHFEPGSHLTGLKRARAGRSDQGAALVADFALELLHSAIARKLVNKRAHAQLVRPMFGHLLAGLQHKAAKVQASTLRVVSAVASWDALDLTQWERVVEELFALLRANSKPTLGGPARREGEVAALVHKTLVRLVRQGKVGLSAEQLTVLLSQTRVDLQDGERRGAAFAVLRALVDRKVLGEGLVECIEDAERLVFTASKDADRLAAGQICTHFLLSYPLQNVQQHVEFLVANLDFPGETGRLSGLQMLLAVCSKMPDAQVADLCDFILLPLVTRLVNDEVASCQAACAEIIRTLLQRAGGKAAGRVLKQYLPSWLQASNEDAVRAGCTVAGLAAEVLGPKCGAGLGELACRVLEEDGKDWRLVFAALCALDKLLRYKSGLELTTVPSFVLRLCVHEHAWVRMQTNQVLALLLEAKVELGAGEHFELAKALVDQLDSDALSVEIAACLAKVLLPALVRLACRRPADFLDGAENAGQVLYWLAKRLGKAARRKDREPELKQRRRGAALAGLRTMVVEARREDLPLSQLVTAIQHEGDDRDDEGVEVMDLLRKRVGAEKFVQALAQVREWADKNREESKAIKRVRKVTDMETVEVVKRLKRERDKRSLKKRREELRRGRR